MANLNPVRLTISKPIPTIQHHLAANGNPPAVIETDDDRTYFLMTIPCRPDMIDSGVVISHESETTNKNNNLSLTEQLIDELTKSDLQVFNSDNHSIKINYSKLVGELIGHHLQVVLM